jgi:membrane protease YdiL (CAAX protease family)
MYRRPILELPLWGQCLLLAVLLIFSLFSMGVLALSLPSTAYQAQALVNSLGVMLLPSLVFGWLVYKDPLREGGFRASSSGWYYLVAAVIMLGAIPLVQVMAGWNEHLHLPKSLDKWVRDTQASQDGFIDRMLRMPTVGALVGNLFTMAFCVAVSEEAFFRGVVQKLLVKATRNVHVGIWLGAILFSAMHFQFLGFFSRVLLGLILGYLYVFSGSLWPSITAHFVYNGFQVFYAYLQQRNPALGNDVTIPLSYGLLSTVLVLGGFAWMRRIKPNTWP